MPANSNVVQHPLNRGLDASERKDDLLDAAVKTLMSGKTLTVCANGESNEYSLDEVRLHLFGNSDDLERYDNLLDRLMIAEPSELEDIREQLRDVMERSTREFVDLIAEAIWSDDEERRADEAAESTISEREFYQRDHG